MEAVDATDVDIVRIDLSTIGTDGDVEDDHAVTGRFARHSAPYLSIEIKPARTFVRTVQVPTIGFDPKWYEASEQALGSIEEPEPAPPKASWWWLPISLAVAGAIVTAFCM